MARVQEAAWLVAAASAAGLAPTVRQLDNRDVVLDAAGTTGEVAWRLEGRIVDHSEGLNEHWVSFIAPGLAAPEVTAKSLALGAQGQATHSVEGGYGSKPSSSELGAAISLGVEAFKLLRRKAKRESAPRPEPSFAISPGPGFSDALLARFAQWRTAPPKEFTGHPPRFTLRASPWMPLTFQAFYWNDAELFTHQHALWLDAIRELVASRVLVSREPASIQPPSKEDFDAGAQALADHLKSQRRDR